MLPPENEWSNLLESDPLQSQDQIEALLMPRPFLSFLLFLRSDVLPDNGVKHQTHLLGFLALNNLQYLDGSAGGEQYLKLLYIYVANLLCV